MIIDLIIRVVTLEAEVVHNFGVEGLGMGTPNINLICTWDSHPIQEIL